MTVSDTVRRALHAILVLVLAAPLTAADGRVRVTQTNAAGDNVTIIDPATNTVVGEITLYSYSLPDLELLGSVEVGLSADWVTLTPDGRTAYVANAAPNSVSVIDVKSMKEVTRIPVGQVPKRNITAVLR